MKHQMVSVLLILPLTRRVSAGQSVCTCDDTLRSCDWRKAHCVQQGIDIFVRLSQAVVAEDEDKAFGLARRGHANPFQIGIQ